MTVSFLFLFILRVTLLPTNFLLPTFAVFSFIFLFSHEGYRGRVVTYGWRGLSLFLPQA
jgi:hypothetical protein